MCACVAMVTLLHPPRNERDLYNRAEHKDGAVSTRGEPEKGQAEGEARRHTEGGVKVRKGRCPQEDVAGDWASGSEASPNHLPSTFN